MIPKRYRCQGFYTSLSDPTVTYDITLRDHDQRRFFQVRLKGERSSFDMEQMEELDDEMNRKAAAFLADRVDGLDPNVNCLVVEKESIVRVCTNPYLDESSYNVPLSEYKRPEHVGTVLRSELTELERLLGVDIVSYVCRRSGETKKVAFKYGATEGPAMALWAEINIFLRLPPHPNIMSLDSLVLDELTGTAVVGFTLPYVAGGDLCERLVDGASSTSAGSRLFKLKWMRQLMQAVDDLNLRYGILHQDVSPRNMLVDAETDNLLLFDFGHSGKIGTPWRKINDVGAQARGEIPHRDDVKGVLFAVHEIITRDSFYDANPYLESMDEASIQDREKWVKHPQVRLDHDVSVYYDELMAWARERRSRQPLTHYTQASEYIDWPPFPEDPPEIFFEGCKTCEELGPSRSWSRDRSHHGTHGLYLDWSRPPSSKLVPGRRLLATGRYVDVGSGDGPVAGANDPAARAEGDEGRSRKATGSSAAPSADLQQKKKKTGRRRKEEGRKNTEPDQARVTRIPRVKMPAAMGERRTTRSMTRLAEKEDRLRA